LFFIIGRSMNMCGSQNKEGHHSLHIAVLKQAAYFQDARDAPSDAKSCSAQAISGVSHGQRPDN
jgi:hypothetical protein